MGGFSGFCNFSLRSSTVERSERCWFAHFNVVGDFTHLFPFIQAVAHGAVHYESPEYIQFKMDDVLCDLYPPDMVVSRLFCGKEQALEFAHRLIEFLNDLEARRSQIKPDYRKYRRLHVPEILRCLPMTNCGECGFRTCLAFAAAVSRRRAVLMMCPDFPEPARARIIFLVNGEGHGETAKIEVDPDLAGVSISRVSDAGIGPSRQTAPKRRVKRWPGLKGNRDGIIFRLSGREAEVLRLMTEGFTNREIALILKVSQHTVKSHVDHIFNKLGINNRTQAAVWAAQNGLI